MEETESTVELAMRSRVGSRRLRREIQHDEVEELKLSLVTNYETPEPQYTETKSSILRRRNSMAKLNNSGKFSDGVQERTARRKSRRRFSSLTDLSAKRNSNSRKRRNSISYDEINQLKQSYRGSETSSLAPPPSTFGSSGKKFSQYTGTSPKEKIEFSDYSGFRDSSPPRRFTVLSKQSKQRCNLDIDLMHFTFGDKDLGHCNIIGQGFS